MTAEQMMKALAEAQAAAAKADADRKLALDAQAKAEADAKAAIAESQKAQAERDTMKMALDASIKVDAQREVRTLVDLHAAELGANDDATKAPLLALDAVSIKRRVLEKRGAKLPAEPSHDYVCAAYDTALVLGAKPSGAIAAGQVALGAATPVIAADAANTIAEAKRAYEERARKASQNQA